MFHDILIWGMDVSLAYAHSSVLVVVSDEVREDYMFFSTLKNMGRIEYHVFLVGPSKNVPQPDSPEWPKLLLDQVHYLRENFREDSRKKHKAAAAAEGSQDQA